MEDAALRGEVTWVGFRGGLDRVCTRKLHMFGRIELVVIVLDYWLEYLAQAKLCSPSL